MYFKEKLKLLMDLFKISNSQLARAINVDASLISRWKSGQRQVTAQSPHLPALAQYFIRYHGYQYQHEALNRILQSTTGTISLTDEADKVQALANWLVSDVLPGPTTARSASDQASKFEQLIMGVSQILSEPIRGLEQNMPVLSDKDKAVKTHLENMLRKIAYERRRSQITRSDSMSQNRTTKGTHKTTAHPSIYDLKQLLTEHDAAASMPYQKFFGFSGRRNAVLSFLFQLLRQPEAKNVYLFSEESMDWLLEDKAFTYLWAKLLMEVIKCGHYITIIHVVDRDLGEMLKMMRYWMPLHLSGQLKSYYRPGHSRRSVRQTRFIIADELILTSDTIAGSDDATSSSKGKQDHLSLLIRDTDVVHMYQQAYLTTLKDSQPLFSLYHRKLGDRLADDIKHFLIQDGAYYSLRDDFNLFSMPETLFSDIQVKLALDLPREAVARFTRYRNIYLEQMRNSPCVQIYPLQLLDQIAEERCITFLCPELFMKKTVSLTTRQTIEWLKSMISLLKQHDRYQIMFTPRMPGFNRVHVNIDYKAYASAFFSSNIEAGERMIRIDEHNIMHALSYYFDGFIQKIPAAYKQKSEIIERLNKLIQDLESALPAARVRKKASPMSGSKKQRT